MYLCHVTNTQFYRKLSGFKHTGVLSVSVGQEFRHNVGVSSATILVSVEAPLGKDLAVVFAQVVGRSHVLTPGGLRASVSHRLSARGCPPFQAACGSLPPNVGAPQHGLLLPPSQQRRERDSARRSYTLTG